MIRTGSAARRPMMAAQMGARDRNNIDESDWNQLEASRVNAIIQPSVKNPDRPPNGLTRANQIETKASVGSNSLPLPFIHPPALSP